MSIKEWESVIGIPSGGFIGYKTAHAIFGEQWPEGSYFNLIEGCYFIPRVGQ